jgi:hypothetical protein
VAIEEPFVKGNYACVACIVQGKCFIKLHTRDFCFLDVYCCRCILFIYHRPFALFFFLKITISSVSRMSLASWPAAILSISRFQSRNYFEESFLSFIYLYIYVYISSVKISSFICVCRTFR